MAVIKQPVGAPVWFELNSTDAARSRDFHAAVFRLDAVDHPMDHHDGAYTIFDRDGDEVAACSPMMPEQQQAGAPSHWAIYFRVADCDATVAAATKAGARLLAGPFEVDEHLRMAVLEDPTGAAFCIAQLRQHTGVGRIHEVDSIGWTELATRDMQAAMDFYGPLLGWSFAEHEGSAAPYRIFSVEGTRQGGIMQMDEQWGDMPSHWSIYWRVADVDATIDRAVAHGGSVCVPAFDAPGVGRIARIDDPAGAGAYLIALTGIDAM